LRRGKEEEEEEEEDNEHFVTKSLVEEDEVEIIVFLCVRVCACARVHVLRAISLFKRDSLLDLKMKP